MEILVIPDIHIGEKNMPLAHIHAVRKAIAAATERKAQIVFIGDMVEMTDITDEYQVIESCKYFAPYLRLYAAQTRRSIATTLGNHDRYLNEQHLATLFPGVPFEIHKHWWLKDGVLLHHGHLADVARNHILDHLERIPDRSLAGIQRFIDTDLAYREDRRRYHSRNMIDLWALMRFAETKVCLSNRRQLQLYDAYYAQSLDDVNRVLKGRTQAPNLDQTSDDRRRLPAELAFNEFLADNDDTDLWAIGQGHMHNPYLAPFFTPKRRRPILFNAGMIYGVHRDPSCVWINAKNPHAKTCTLYIYTKGSWQIHRTAEYQRNSSPYLTQPSMSTY